MEQHCSFYPLQQNKQSGRNLRHTGVGWTLPTSNEWSSRSRGFHHTELAWQESATNQPTNQPTSEEESEQADSSDRASVLCFASHPNI
jgi:hypothetical protein